MKKYFLLMAIFCSHTLYAQKFGPKTKVGVVFSADACYRTLASGSNWTWIVNARNSREIPRTGFTTGLSYVYGFGRFSVETGAQYSSKGYQTNFTELRYQMPEPGAPTEARFIYKYSYLDVPLKLMYNFNIAKLNFFVSTGTSANIFLEDETKAIRKYEDGSTVESTAANSYNYNPVNFAAMASFGVEISVLTDKVRLRIEPIYRHSVTSIIDAPVKGYLNSTGINAGIFVGL